MKLKKQADILDLQVNFYGIPLPDKNYHYQLIDSFVIQSLDDNEEQFSPEHLFLNSYEQLAERYLTIEETDYNRLMSVGRELPSDYFDRFYNLHWVWVDGVVSDENHFLWFLKNLAHLAELRISFANLSQAFYSELPSFCSLRYFTLDEYEQFQLDFEFFGKFRNLTWFVVTQNLSLKSAKSLVKAFGYLKKRNDFDLELNGKKFSVKRLPAGDYRLLDTLRYDELDLRTKCDRFSENVGKNKLKSRRFDPDRFEEELDSWSTLKRGTINEICEHLEKIENGEIIF